MKTRILVGILFTLLERKRVSAGELAQKYGCSERSIFRYIDELTCAGIPIDVVRGANGGICISDAFKLPRGLLTREEGLRLSEAIKAMCEQLRDPALLSAAKKLEVQYCDEPLTLGNILVDSGSWGDRHNFSDKLSLLENAISERAELAIDYVNREGEYTRRRIQPHLLVLKQNVWYVFAWCMLRKEFRLFKLGRIRAAVRTGKTFERHFFLRDAENILSAEAVVLVGTRQQVQGLDCAYCGFARCAQKPQDTPCAINAIDVGIAVGSACSVAADHRADTRVMFSAGMAAQQLGLLEGCRQVIAIPVSIS